jgi:type II secretory pathway pseudopilin PulG
MQYRLSTIFLVFFVTATSLATFGACGLLIAPLILAIALFINRAKRTLIEYLVVFAIIGIIVAILLPAPSVSRENVRREQCIENLKFIGNSLQLYHGIHGHFPPLVIKDANGQALYGWRLEIMSAGEYREFYEKINKHEPWDSDYNSKNINPPNPQFGCFIGEYSCPSCPSTNTANASNYIAVAGPDTAWREEGTVRFEDLPDGGRHTVMAMEYFDSNKHWAEPDLVTVDQILDQMKNKSGIENFSNHPDSLYVLLANGSVWSISKGMPVELWKKLLAGNIKDLDELNGNGSDQNESWAFCAYEPPSITHVFRFIQQHAALTCAVIVWLFSVFLLFRRAVKSRKKHKDSTSETKNNVDKAS